MSAVGDRVCVQKTLGPVKTGLELGKAAVLPGFVEAHGHLVNEAMALTDWIVDIRPGDGRDRGRGRAGPR